MVVFLDLFSEQVSSWNFHDSWPSFMVMEPWRLTKLNSELELTLKIVEVCQDDSDNGPLASINEEMHVMIPEYKIK